MVYPIKMKEAVIKKVLMGEKPYHEIASEAGIQRHFSIEHITCELPLRHEIFPSQQAPALIMHQSQIRLGLLTWGLVPFWAKEKKGSGLINARMETLSKKPSFREPFIKRRCLIIADGYYEWKQPSVLSARYVAMGFTGHQPWKGACNHHPPAS